MVSPQKDFSRFFGTRLDGDGESSDKRHITLINPVDRTKWDYTMVVK